MRPGFSNYPYTRVLMHIFNFKHVLIDVHEDQRRNLAFPLPPLFILLANMTHDVL